MWKWISSCFTKTRSLFRSAFKESERIAEKALPIIAEVDVVKAEFDAAESNQTRWQVIATFLSKHIDTTKDAGILVNMPRADMLTKLAIIAVQAMLPNVPSGYIRLAVGLAWVAHSLMRETNSGKNSDAEKPIPDTPPSPTT